MRVLGYIMLHYGMEYLEYAIRAIDPFCEKIMIFYTPKPSHGTWSGKECPENEEELKKLAYHASKKVEWVKKQYMAENMHRREVFKYSKGYDLVLNADSDEVWDQAYLEDCLKQAVNTDSRYIGIYGFINFYRSFNWVVEDFFYPIRIHNLKSNKREVKTLKGKVYHFGYAQREEILRYKIGIHGHSGEWKPNWLENKWLNFDPLETSRMHPCSNDVWIQAKPFDKTMLPDMLKDHPYYDLDRIT